jgi:hypothetical protein
LANLIAEEIELDSMTKVFNPTDNLPTNRSLPRRKPVRTGKVVLKTLDHLDGRTLAARRAHELIRAISRDLTGEDNSNQLSEGTRQLVQRAAMLGAMVESNEACWLSGDTVDLALYFSALNNQRRILVTLGLDRRAKDVTPPTVEAYLAHMAKQKEDKQREADAEEVVS